MKRNIFILVIIVGFFSCEDFLTEDFKSGENSQSVLSSEETFESLINSTYVSLRAWYGKENSWDLTEAGTDLYTWGLDNRSQGFCTYATFTTAEEQERVGAIWRELYKALNTCNIVLSEIDGVPYKSDELKEQRKAEVSFLRAHYLWLISEIWGGVHFTTEPSQEATRSANRTPVSEFRAQIFADLEYAASVLPDEYGSADYGRATKPAAEAMLARVHLYNEDWAEAAQYAQNVINNYNFRLLDDWSEIWDIENIKNDEVVWVVNYSDDPVFTKAQFTDPNGNIYNTSGIIQREGGHTGHVMFEIRYENLGWGLVRDVENGRGFQRWGPTKYFIDLYDDIVDERFHGSFKTEWRANDLAAVPKWRPFVFVNGERRNLDRELWAQPMFEIGDLAIKFSKRPVPETQKGKFSESDIFYIHPEEGYIIIDINDMYLPDGSMNDNVINRQFYFPITKKYRDPTRPQLSTAFSKRDAYVFRISEMYLIAAEAELMQGNKSATAQWLSQLRKARAIDGFESEMLVDADDMDIDFILEERARELATEFQRFFDLRRTGKLVERVKAYNHDAAPFIQEYHGYRFIPQSQIDAMVDGSDYQNPGY